MILHINYLFWLGLAAILSILDLVFGANFFLIVLAACSGIIALITYILPKISWQEQVVLFACVAMFILYFWIKYVKKGSDNKYKINMNMEKFIGRQAVLIEASIAGYSKIRLDDSFWKVYSEQQLNKDTLVEVVSVNNLTLVVKPIK